MSDSDQRDMWAVTIKNGHQAVKVPIPGRASGEALVRVERVGICGTDLALFDGYTGFQGIIGHEFAGVVVEADSPYLLNSRITASINIALDHSIQVTWKAAKHDPDRSALGIRKRDGAMAEYVTIPEEYLYSA